MSKLIQIKTAKNKKLFHIDVSCLPFLEKKITAIVCANTGIKDSQRLLLVHVSWPKFCSLNQADKVTYAYIFKVAEQRISEPRQA